MNPSAYTTFLFAEPSFLAGFAAVLDLGGTLTEYNESESPLETDARAIAMDWRAVGQDLWAAVAHGPQ